MRNIKSRAGALVGAVMAAMMAGATPGFGGPVEAALLEQYLGIWRGDGLLTGALDDKVSCRMTVARGKGEKLNYSGRCALARGQFSLTGAVAYSEAQRQYEGSLFTGVGNFRGRAVGRLKGQTVTFELQQVGEDSSGNEVSSTSVLTLSDGQLIEVKFHAVFADSSDTIDAVLRFTKG